MFGVLRGQLQRLSAAAIVLNDGIRCSRARYNSSSSSGRSIIVVGGEVNVVAVVVVTKLVVVVVQYSLPSLPLPFLSSDLNGIDWVEQKLLGRGDRCTCDQSRNSARCCRFRRRFTFNRNFCRSTRTCSLGFFACGIHGSAGDVPQQKCAMGTHPSCRQYSGRFIESAIAPKGTIAAVL